MDHGFDEDYMLFMLNTLGQTYNASSKFNVNNKIMADITDSKFKNFINEAFDKGYMIKNHEGYNFYELSEIKNNDPLYFDKKYLEQKSKVYVIYKFVTLKCSNKCEIDKKYNEITLSSFSKGDNINIEDILNSTSTIIGDKNKVVVDFRYNKRNKYRKINKSGYYSIVLEPGFTI
jgi:hypothetical protein